MQYTEIQKQFNKVIANSQNIPNPQTDKLFADWLEAKRDFIEAFQGKLIYTWPEKVTFELSDREKIRKIEDFIWQVEQTWHNKALVLFLESIKDDFYANKLSKVYETEDFTIPKGMKVIRAFKYFASGTELTALQNSASMLIQDNKITGTLCLSVHPLDFLSTSENNHNWRSCHALDGEYRGGNLSYMVDKSTFICYLKSEKDEILPNFPNDVPWNSKKWRVLFCLSENWDMIFAGRQYPFSSETGIEFVRDRVLPAAKIGTFTHFMDKLIHSVADENTHMELNYQYIPNGSGELVPLIKIVEDYAEYEEPIHFNDLLKSSCYSPHYAFKTVESFWGGHRPIVQMCNNRPHMTIGGHVRCLRCAERPISSIETMMCDSCESEYGDSENYIICGCCGRRVYIDDAYFIESIDEYCCENCWSANIVACDECGEEILREDAIYDRNTEAYYCSNCAHQLKIDDDEE